MIIILFGLSGTGKNFIGNLFASHFDFHFWDADEALTDEMRKAIANKKLFTQTMRDKLTGIMITYIQQLTTRYPDIVIAQALYKEKNRLQLQQAFPDAQFYWVKTDNSIIIQRKTSPAAVVDIEYANRMASNFEEPKLPHRVLINNDDKVSIINQLKNFKIY